MPSPLADLSIERTARSRLGEVDFDAIGFGNVFSDHMLSVHWREGGWGPPEITPYAPILVEPGCVALHYGQSVFEGLKAFRGSDGRIRVFRADRNAERLADSCRRLCIPPPPDGLLEAAIAELVRIDHAWIPRRRGQALYIRPLIFAEESHLEVRPAVRYRLLVMTAPVRTYYADGFVTVSLKVQDQYTRAAPGGIGFAKTAGNYSASLLPADESRREGYAQALWLDGATHQHVEEVGHMNIFFDLDGTIVTPELRGSILPGITRESVITLLRERGFEVEERRVAIAEVVEGARSGRLREAFGSGTATVIAPVGLIGYRGARIPINENAPGPVAKAVYDAILGIQLGEVEDRHGWTTVVEIDAATVPAAAD